MLTIEQQEIRKKGLGATDCAVVLGLSPYQTPYELWMLKTGRVENQAILDENRLRLRHAHEETIAKEYAVQKEVKLRRVNKTIFHPKYPFMLCHLDRIVMGQKKIVECKSSTAFLKQNWGLSGSDEAPLHYILQVQHQLACSNYELVDIAALIDIDDYRIYPYQRNEAIISKIESECERFWNEHVLADIPPPPLTKNDLKLMYPTNNGQFIEASSHILICIDEINRMKKEIKCIEDDKEKLEQEIMSFIADKDGLLEDGKTIATFIANKIGNRILRIKERRVQQ